MDRFNPETQDQIRSISRREVEYIDSWDIRNLCRKIQRKFNAGEEIKDVAMQLFDTADVMHEIDEPTDSEYDEIIESLHSLIISLCLLIQGEGSAQQIIESNEVLSDDLYYYLYRTHKNNPDRSVTDQEYIDQNNAEFEDRYNEDPEGGRRNVEVADLKN